MFPADDTLVPAEGSSTTQCRASVTFPDLTPRLIPSANASTRKGGDRRSSRPIEVPTSMTPGHRPRFSYNVVSPNSIAAVVRNFSLARHRDPGIVVSTHRSPKHRQSTRSEIRQFLRALWAIATRHYLLKLRAPGTYLVELLYPCFAVFLLLWLQSSQNPGSMTACEAGSLLAASRRTAMTVTAAMKEPILKGPWQGLEGPELSMDAKLLVGTVGWRERKERPTSAEAATEVIGSAGDKVHDLNLDSGEQGSGAEVRNNRPLAKAREARSLPAAGSEGALFDVTKGAQSAAAHPGAPPSLLQGRWAYADIPITLQAAEVGRRLIANEADEVIVASPGAMAERAEATTATYGTEDALKVVDWGRVTQQYGVWALIWTGIFLLPNLRFAQGIMEEKEYQIREYIQLYGASDFAYWCGHYITSLSMSLVQSGIIVGLCWYFLGGCIYLTLLFALMALFMVTGISLTILVTACVDSTRVALFVYTSVYLLLLTPFVSLGSSNGPGRFVQLLSPPSALVCGLDQFVGGFSPSHELGQPRLAQFCVHVPTAAIFVFMAFDLVLYFAVGWYIYQVRPGAVGVPKKWNFFLKGSYWRNYGRQWRPRRKKWATPQTYHQLEETSDLFEKNYKDGLLEPLLVIAEVHKIFPMTQKKKLKRIWVWILKKLDIAAIKPPVGHHCLKGVSLAVYKNEVFCLMGKNGSGKTILMKILSGFLDSTSGDVIIDGHDVHKFVGMSRRSVGYCPQANFFFDNMTIGEQYHFAASLKNIPKMVAACDIEIILRRLELYDKINMRPAQLSMGEKKRAQIGMAFLGDPKIVLIDDLSTGLDPLSKRVVWRTLQEMKRGLAVLFTTHDPLEACVLADRLAIIEGGVLKANGNPVFLKSRFENGYTLRVIDTGEQSDSAARFADLIAYRCPNSYSLHDLGVEYVYKVPFCDTHHLPRLLHDLERYGERLGIRDVSVSTTTLTEVIARASEDSTAEAERRKARQAEINSTQAWSTFLSRTSTRPVLVQPEASQYGAWGLTKRLSDPQMNTQVMDLPSAKSTESSHWSSLACTAETLEWSQDRYVHREPGYIGDPSVFDEAKARWRLARSAYNNFVRNVLAIFWKRLHCTRKDGWLLWYQLLFPATFVILYTMAQAAAYSEASYEDHDPGPSNPWPLRLPSPLDGRATADQIAEDDSRKWKRILRAVWIVIGCEMIPSVWANYVTHERATGSKLHQHAAGISISTYWFGELIWNMSVFLVSGTFVILAQVAMQKGPYTHGSTFGYFLLTLILFAWSSAACAYFLSFFFKSGTTIQAVMIAGAVLIPSLIGAFHAINTNAYATWATYIFLIVPHAAFAQVCYSISFSCIGRDYECEFTGVVDDNGNAARTTFWAADSNLVPVLYLAIEIFVYFFLVIFFDALQHDPKLKAVLHRFRCIKAHETFQRARSRMREHGKRVSLRTNSALAWARRREVAGLDAEAAAVSHAVKLQMAHAATRDIAPPLRDALAASTYDVDSQNDVCKESLEPYGGNTTARSRELYWKREPARPAKSVRRKPDSALEMVHVRSTVQRNRRRSVEELAMHDKTGAVALIAEGITKLELRRVAYMPACYKRVRRALVDHASFIVRTDSVMGFVGLNGSGKSTMLNLLAGKLAPTTGKVYLDGMDLTIHPYFRWGRVGLCPQMDASLEPKMTGREILEMFGRINMIERTYLRRTVIPEALQLVQLKDLKNRPVEKYSAGDRRKLSFILSMMMGNRILLLDSPSMGVDILSRRRIWALIAKSRQVLGRAVVVASACPEECEALCDRVACLEEGRIKAVGDLDLVRRLRGQAFEVLINVNAFEHLISPQGSVFNYELTSTFRTTATVKGPSRSKSGPATSTLLFAFNGGLSRDGSVDVVPEGLRSPSRKRVTSPSAWRLKRLRLSPSVTDFSAPHTTTTYTPVHSGPRLDSPPVLRGSATQLLRYGANQQSIAARTPGSIRFSAAFKRHRSPGGEVRDGDMPSSVVTPVAVGDNSFVPTLRGGVRFVDPDGSRLSGHSADRPNSVAGSNRRRKRKRSQPIRNNHMLFDALGVLTPPLLARTPSLVFDRAELVFQRILRALNEDFPGSELVEAVETHARIFIPAMSTEEWEEREAHEGHRQFGTLSGLDADDEDLRITGYSQDDVPTGTGDPACGAESATSPALEGRGIIPRGPGGFGISQQHRYKESSTTSGSPPAAGLAALGCLTYSPSLSNLTVAGTASFEGQSAAAPADENRPPSPRPGPVAAPLPFAISTVPMSSSTCAVQVGNLGGATAFASQDESFKLQPIKLQPELRLDLASTNRTSYRSDDRVEPFMRKRRQSMASAIHWSRMRNSNVPSVATIFEWFSQRKDEFHLLELHVASASIETITLWAKAHGHRRVFEPF